MDLTTKENAQVARQQIKGKKLTLRDMKRASLPSVGKGIYIVADISGSMGGNKLTSLKDTLRKVYKPGIKVYAFSDETFELQQSDFSAIRAMGGTSMLAGLRDTWCEDPKHIILITDGQPTDASENEILIAVEAHNTIPIDTIGISEYGHKGFNAKFLEEISRITGGKFNDCSRPFELTFIVETLLIGMGSEKRGVIPL